MLGMKLTGSLPSLLAIAAICGLAFASLAAAQEKPDAPAVQPPPGSLPPPPPPPKPPKRPGPPGGLQKGPPRGDGRGPGAFRGPGRGPMHPEGFEKLPEEEKQRIRAAMEKAWGMPKVQEARDRLMRANDEFRAAMRASLQEIDPEVVKIMDKVKPAQPPDPSLMPKWPKPEDPDFIASAADRIGQEFMAFARPENREASRRMHERVMQRPDVTAALDELKNAEPGIRMAALGKLRMVYREAVGQEFRQARQQQQTKPQEKSDLPEKP